MSDCDVSKMEELTAQPQPEGFTCECGAFHRFGAYVNAHWREELIHTCTACERKHSVQFGDVTLIEPQFRKGGSK